MHWPKPKSICHFWHRTNSLHRKQCIELKSMETKKKNHRTNNWFGVYAIRIPFNSRVIVQIVIFLMGISSVKWKLHKSLEIMYRFNTNIVLCVRAAAQISRTSQWANNNDILENCFNFTRASIIGNFSAASYDMPCLFIWMWLSVYMRNKSITSITSSPSKSNYFLRFKRSDSQKFVCNMDVTVCNTNPHTYIVLIIHYNKSSSSSSPFTPPAAVAHHRQVFQLFTRWW